MMQIVGLDIEGMGCMNCVARLEQRLAGLGGVRRATVLLESATATVVFDSSLLQIDQIISAVASIRLTATVRAADLDDEREWS